jgi:hypothetical protein
MMDERLTYHGIEYKIEQDSDYESPREWDNLGRMLCFHRRYKLGDEDLPYDASEYSNWEELKNQLVRDGAVLVFSLYLYDHSGISISISSGYPYNDVWDAGQVGLIYVLREDLLREFGAKRVSPKLLKKAEEIIRTEVKIYDQCLTGDVWGYIVYDSDGEQYDSCWGFYGYDYCEKEAQGVIDSMLEHKMEESEELQLVVSD